MNNGAAAIVGMVMGGVIRPVPNDRAMRPRASGTPNTSSANDGIGVADAHSEPRNGQQRQE